MIKPAAASSATGNDTQGTGGHLGAFLKALYSSYLICFYVFYLSRGQSSLSEGDFDARTHAYHLGHISQGTALSLIQLAFDGRHLLQLLLSVTVAGDALLCFHRLLLKKQDGNIW